MDVGMLWFDNNPKTSLKAKIISAAHYYRQKYGHVPNFCQVNPGQFEEIDLGILKVTQASNILPGHLWIGIKNDAQPAN